MLAKASCASQAEALIPCGPAIIDTRRGGHNLAFTYGQRDDIARHYAWVLRVAREKFNNHRPISSHRRGYQSVVFECLPSLDISTKTRALGGETVTKIRVPPVGGGARARRAYFQEQITLQPSCPALQEQVALQRDKKRTLPGGGSTRPWQRN